MCLGTLKQVYDNMENGVTNFCKDGKCIGCGQCCSDLLPLSESEIKDIRRYVVKKHIKPTVRVNAVSIEPTLDLICPFLDDTKTCDKCKIYPVRPKICRAFQCNQPPSKVRANKELFWKSRKGYSMRELFFGNEILEREDEEE